MPALQALLALLRWRCWSPASAARVLLSPALMPTSRFTATWKAGTIMQSRK